MRDTRLLSFAICIAACFAGTLAAQSVLAVTGLPAGAPLAVIASATPTELTVVLALQPEWHVYSRDVGGGQPVMLRLADDCAFRAAGPRQMPAGVGGKVHGDVEVKLPLQATGAGGELQAVLDFMVCDPLLCLPPMSVTLSGTVAAARQDGFPVLLVVDEPDERSERVAAFLCDRGFEVGIATYAEVKPDTCARYEVLLCDSKRFGSVARSARNAARQLPKVEQPLVAVGFLGTELVEAHGVAMTSGYI